MTGRGKRRALPDMPTMRDVVVKRSAPARRSGDGDRDVYFQLSLFAAERAKIQQRLDDLQAQQDGLRKRLEVVEAQMRKLRGGLDSAEAAQAETGARYRWNEVELEY